MSLVSTYLSAMRASIRPVRRLRVERLWEVDAGRGVAIVMMVIYHLAWDLWGFGGFDIDLRSGFWHYFQLITANLFIGIVGVSLALRYQRMTSHGQPRYAPFFQRGVVIFSWGVVVGLVTFLFAPSRYVQFGILHLIGFSTLVAYPFLRWRWANLVLAALIFLMGRVVKIGGWDASWLGWVGLDASPRPAYDFFPFIPWFGVILLGVFLGNTLYTHGERRFSLPDLSRVLPVRWLQLLGQNSLLIYLIHQPILIASLMLLGIARP